MWCTYLREAEVWVVSRSNSTRGGGARLTGGRLAAARASPRQQRPPPAPRPPLHSVRAPAAVGRAATRRFHWHQRSRLTPPHISHARNSPVTSAWPSRPTIRTDLAMLIISSDYRYCWLTITVEDSNYVMSAYNIPNWRKIIKRTWRCWTTSRSCFHS